MAKILIIDDDPLVCCLLSDSIGELGHDVRVCSTLQKGLEENASADFDVLFLDVMLPDGCGLDAIKGLKNAESSPEVIIITGAGDPDAAELAIRSGAWDYIQKPLTLNTIHLPLLRVLEYRKAKSLQKKAVPLRLDSIVGKSRKIAACIEQLAHAAASDANVLITGETGTGKELFARALYENGPRCNRPFVVVDCAALPESIVESLLFGHEKGAFTGAEKSHEGLIKQAHGGTLFLDEVGELPSTLQKTFLRVLQEHRFRPVGSKHEETSDFRLIAATNQDLERMVTAGSFRSDLLFRLRSYVIELPPLRERREDIRELVLRFLTKACERSGMRTKGFSPDFFEVLEAYDWPGNVRELYSTLQSALTSAFDEPILYSYHLPVAIRGKAARLAFNRGAVEAAQEESMKRAAPGMENPLPLFREYRNRLLEDGEGSYFAELVMKSRGEVAEAIRISGLSRTRLYDFLQKHNLSLSMGTPIE